MKNKLSRWVRGLAEWTEGDTVYISIAFTWFIDDAIARAEFARALGKSVKVVGPAVFLNQFKKRFEGIAEVGGTYPDAVRRHNPDATFASRGCPVGCWFCIVPAMEGREFTLLPDFPVRPILCDNNLSGLPIDYQKYIIERYQKSGVEIRDANSGFEPHTFDDEIYRIWKTAINRGGGPWRFAYDETDERREVLAMMKILKNESPRRKRVYVLIGNEPFADCMARIDEVIAGGCEPYCQPLMKLNSIDRSPWIKHDWTPTLLKDVSRWINGFVYKVATFGEYLGPTRNRQRYDPDAPQINLLTQ